MDSNKDKYYKCFLIMIIGFIFIVINFSVEFKNIYPAYSLSDKLVGQYQNYILNLQYGTDADAIYIEKSGEVIITAINFKGLRVDIINDYIGYGLLLLAFIGMIRKSKYFKFGAISTIMAIVLEVVIDVLPFFITGGTLCHLALFIGLGAFAMKMLVLYSVAAGVSSILTGIQHRNDRRMLFYLWFGLLVLSTIVQITTWLILPKLTFTYNILLLFVIVGMVVRLFTLRDYVSGYKECSTPVSDVKVGIFDEE